MKKYRIIITGIVQGVGFRPFIYNMSVQLGLKGWVSNTDSDVIIEIETEQSQITEYINKIRENAPILSKIDSISFEELPIEGFNDFSIRQSQTFSKNNIFISPDVSTCSDCINELKNPHDRRYMYPFINCTNCGPRFTIIKDVPYDRDKTTMSSFEMCTRCNKEYTTPSDRRYHAQPVSCHDCGPSLGIADENGSISYEQMTGRECIEYIANILKSGQIAAIKGIGGYHLACDASSIAAVDRLRARKHRDDKPFALMVKNIDAAAKYCNMNNKEIQLLLSPQSPIVLLEKKADIKLPAAIARLNRYLGIMLPYTPIHHILFEQQGFPEIIVMTSGNQSSEPIFYKDDEAISGLIGIADAFLTNNRDIYIRTDDSVTRIYDNKEYIIRRSRGYVPKPVKIDAGKLLQTDGSFEIPAVLACGGELKNVFCLNKNNLFYLSHHIGDLENESTNNAFRSGVEHFKKLFGITPEYIAYDLHPGYYSSQYALELKEGNKIAVQHHKAHIASCMAENQLSGEVIGVSFDGTGFGEDGSIWGGEFFTGGYYGFERAGHLEYIMMPGGDSAVKHPWRMAVSCLFAANMTDLITECNNNEHCDDAHDNSLNSEHYRDIHCKDKFLLNTINQDDIDFTIKMLERKLNCPQTSSMGRLFDAVSALLGIKTDISYEGQAAIELEYYADNPDIKPYNIEITGQDQINALEDESIGTGEKGFIIKTSYLIEQIVNDIQNGLSKEYIASRFHSTIAEIVLLCCINIRKKNNSDKVVLSGGVFQNITLLGRTVNLLKKNNFEVYTHSAVPANDGGIALGQAMMALAQIYNQKKAQQ
jgi:hydrogenase maturation protein HypF